MTAGGHGLAPDTCRTRALGEPPSPPTPGNGRRLGWGKSLLRGLDVQQHRPPPPPGTPPTSQPKCLWTLTTVPGGRRSTALARGKAEGFFPKASEGRQRMGFRPLNKRLLDNSMAPGAGTRGSQPSNLRPRHERGSGEPGHRLRQPSKHTVLSNRTYRPPPLRNPPPEETFQSP